MYFTLFIFIKNDCFFVVPNIFLHSVLQQRRRAVTHGLCVYGRCFRFRRIGRSTTRRRQKRSFHRLSGAREPCLWTGQCGGWRRVILLWTGTSPSLSRSPGREKSADSLYERKALPTVLPFLNLGLVFCLVLGNLAASLAETVQELLPALVAAEVVDSFSVPDSYLAVL